MNSRIVIILSMTVLVGLANGQNDFGNLIASNMGAFNLQVYDSGVINCDTFICPTTSFKCVIDKITEAEFTTTTKYCMDPNGRIIDKFEEKVPNLTSRTSYRRSHAEADATGRVVVNNQEQGTGNYNNQSGVPMTPEDIEKMKMMQDGIKDFSNKLRNSIQKQVQESIDNIRGMQFQFTPMTIPNAFPMNMHMPNPYAMNMQMPGMNMQMPTMPNIPVYNYGKK